MDFLQFVSKHLLSVATTLAVHIPYSGYFLWSVIFAFFMVERKFVTRIHVHVFLETVVSVKHVTATIAFLQRQLRIHSLGLVCC